MTILTGKLTSILGTPFGGPGYAVLIKSRMTRRSSGGLAILPLIDRISMPAEEDGGDGEFTTALLDPGPIRVELSGSDRHGDGWDITIPEGDGPFELADLIDAQTEWSPIVVSRAEAAARRAEQSATAAESSAGSAGGAEVRADGFAQSAGQSATLAGEHAEATGDDRRQTGEDRQATGEDVDETEALSAAAVAAASLVEGMVATALGQYRGTGFPEGVVTAPVGSIYTDTAATNGAIRWIKTTGTGNTGWAVEYGYTGIRDITSLIPDNDDRGRARISRTNNLVTLHLVNVPTPGTGSFVSLDGIIPEGFRSSFNWQYLGVGQPTGIDASGPIRVGTNSTLIVYRTSSETRVNASVIYESATTWPTVLPGVPD